MTWNRLLTQCHTIYPEVPMQLARSLLILPLAFAAIAQDDRPDPKEIPITRIKTPLGTLPESTPCPYAGSCPTSSR